MQITVLDGYTLNPSDDNPWAPIEALGSVTVYDATPTNQIIERAANADIILTNKTPLTADTLRQLPNLKFISVLATGYNVVDTTAARQQDIAVANIPEYGTASVAQFTFALLLELCHHVAHHSQAVHAGRWQQSKHFCFWDFPLTELAGKNMGIIGFGRIGRQVGAIARVMGMNILAHSTTQSQTADYPFEWCDLSDLLTRADVVTLHCPLTVQNKHLFNTETLQQMKSSSFLINTARGGLIDEQALATALRNNQIAGFACDVLSTEPPNACNPLLQSPNTIITPHIAWASLDARKRLMNQTARNIQSFLDGNPVNVVN